MRVERHGGAPDLEKEFTTFIRRRLGGTLLDESQDRHSTQGKFPDFECFRGLLVIEMKHLESDQSEKLRDVLRRGIATEDRPFFYGHWDADRILARVSNGQKIKRDAASKLARMIETDLRQADDQFGSYRQRSQRKNFVSVCTILNSKIAEFSPDVVLWAVHQKMRSLTGGLHPRFQEIDAVLYISEKHFTRLPDGRIAHPIGVFHSATILQNSWKREVVEMLVSRWTNWRTSGAPIDVALDAHPFNVVEDVPDAMKRHDYWRLEYRRNPYFKELSDPQLRCYFRECIEAFSGSSLNRKSSLPIESRMRTIRRFTHLIEEINHRGIDLRTMR